MLIQCYSKTDIMCLTALIFASSVPSSSVYEDLDEILIKLPDVRILASMEWPYIRSGSSVYLMFQITRFCKLSGGEKTPGVAFDDAIFFWVKSRPRMQGAMTPLSMEQYYLRIASPLRYRFVPRKIPIVSSL